MVHLATPQKDLIAQNSEKLDAKSPSHDSPPPHLAIAQSGGIFPWISCRPCPRMGVDQQKYVFVYQQRRSNQKMAIKHDY